MIKICTVCLREVETNARNFKYCENCRADSYRAMRHRWNAQHPNYMRDYCRSRRTIKATRAKVVETRDKFLQWREQNRLQKKV